MKSKEKILKKISVLEKKVNENYKAWKHYRETGRHDIANIFLNAGIQKEEGIKNLKWVLKK